MGCGTPTTEERMLLTKLERLEIQVKKEKELKKLSDLEGKDITSLKQLQGGEEQGKEEETSKVNKKGKKLKIKGIPKKEKNKAKDKDESVEIYKNKSKSKAKKKIDGTNKTEIKTKKKINIKGKKKDNDSKPKLKKKAASEASRKIKKKK